MTSARIALMALAIVCLDVSQAASSASPIRGDEAAGELGSACLDTTLVLGTGEYALVHGARLDTLRLRVIEGADHNYLLINNFTVVSNEERMLAADLTGGGLWMYEQVPLFRQLLAQGIGVERAVLRCRQVERAVAESLIVAINETPSNTSPESLFVSTVARLKDQPLFRGVCSNVVVDADEVRLSFYGWQIPCIVGLSCDRASGRARFANDRDLLLGHARGIIRFFAVESGLDPKLLVVSTNGPMGFTSGPTVARTLEQVASSVRQRVFVPGPLAPRDIEEILARQPLGAQAEAPAGPRLK